MFIINAGILTGILDAILQLGQEARFEMSADGIMVKCADASNTEMFVADMKTTSFVNYNIKEDGVICIDVARLKTMIESAGSDISFLKDEETKQLKIEFGKTKYKMNLIDPTAVKELPRLPDLKFDVSTSMDYKTLFDAIRSVKGISEKGDECIIKSGMNGMEMTFSDKISSVEVEMMDKELPEASAKYTIEYFDASNGILKVLKNCKDILMEYSTDYPMRVSATLGNANLTWLIAPRLTIKD